MVAEGWLGKRDSAGDGGAGGRAGRCIAEPAVAHSEGAGSYRGGGKSQSGGSEGEAASPPSGARACGQAVKSRVELRDVAANGAAGPDVTPEGSRRPGADMELATGLLAVPGGLLQAAETDGAEPGAEADALRVWKSSEAERGEDGGTEQAARAGGRSVRERGAARTAAPRPHGD